MISDFLHSFRVGHVATVTLGVTESIKLPRRYLQHGSLPTGVSNYSIPSCILQLQLQQPFLWASFQSPPRLPLAPSLVLTLHGQCAEGRRFASNSPATCVILGRDFSQREKFSPENCSHGSKELIERSPKPCRLQKSEERIKRYMGFSKFNTSTSFH